MDFLKPFMKERKTLSSFDAQNDKEKKQIQFKKKYIFFLNKPIILTSLLKIFLCLKKLLHVVHHWRRLENYVNLNQLNHDYQKTLKSHRNSLHFTLNEIRYRMKQDEEFK